ncbi:MAG: hypothetical protein WBW62_10850, partial [Solirubrobacterales bacterium]
MKRLLMGMLLALIAQAVLAAPANAGLVPPSVECQATFKTLLKTYPDAILEDASKRERDEADRFLTEGLAAAGCIRDASPFAEEVTLMPFATECRSAAAVAGKHWAPRNRKLLALSRAATRFEKLIDRRVKKLTARIKALAKPKSLKQKRQRKKLTSKLVRLKVKGVIRDIRDGRKVIRLVKPNAYADLLIVYELISRRCLPNGLGASALKAKTPAAKAVRKNLLAIYGSILYVDARLSFTL